MPSAKKLADERGGGGGENLLHGSDLPKSEPLQLRIIAAREAPQTFKSPIILDIEEAIPGKTSLALNVTNTRILAEMLGDDYYQWPGASITVVRVPQRNPQTNQQTWGIAVTAAKAGKQSKSHKTEKPGKKRKEQSEEDDIPF